MDRLDSGIGMLVALEPARDRRLADGCDVLMVGPFIHWTFSMLMFRLGVKARARMTPAR